MKAAEPLLRLAVRDAVLSSLDDNDVDELRALGEMLGVDGTPSVPTVDPHRLVNAGRRWYLVAWDNDPRDWRTFRADRITLRSWSGPRFTPQQPPDPDLAGYTAWAVSTAAYRYRGRFTVHAPAEFVADRMGPTVAVVEPIDDQTCALRRARTPWTSSPCG